MKKLSLYLTLLSVFCLSSCIINGFVKNENGVGVSNVTMTLTGPKSDTVTTDAQGKYQFDDNHNWLPVGTYTVTPSKAGQSFTPPSQTITITTRDFQGSPTAWPVNNVNFKAVDSPEQQTITFNSQYDNAIQISNVLPEKEDTVYQDTPLPVGCTWSYIYLPWPADMYRQDFVCGQGLVKFDLSTIAGKTIDSAKLMLLAGVAGVNPRQWYIHALATSWEPSTVTWNIAESLQYYLGSEVILDPPGYVGQPFQIDVTNIVQNWASGIWDNRGLIFGSNDYTYPNDTSSDMFMFYSLEYPGSGQDWPKLIVTFH